MYETPHSGPVHDSICGLEADIELIERLLRDDEGAWRTFQDIFAGPILRSIVAVGNRFPRLMSREDVSDVYAELCFRLLHENKRRLRQFEPARGIPLRIWLDLLARHATYDFLRNRRRQPDSYSCEELSELDLVVEQATPDPFVVCCAKERMHILASLLADLPPRDREFVSVHYGEGLDPAETAERLGICLSTVYSKKHKIRARIEGLLEKRWAA